MSNIWPIFSSALPSVSSSDFVGLISLTNIAAVDPGYHNFFSCIRPTGKFDSKGERAHFPGESLQHDKKKWIPDSLRFVCMHTLEEKTIRPSRGLVLGTRACAWKEKPGVRTDVETASVLDGVGGRCD